jgi:hypothetical protein
MNRVEFLDTAKDCITRDRAATHGKAEQNFDAIARGWDWWLSIRSAGPLTAYDTAMMMVIFKAARMAGNPAHGDSATDLAGYAALAGELGTEDA